MAQNVLPNLAVLNASLKLTGDGAVLLVTVSAIATVAL